MNLEEVNKQLRKAIDKAIEKQLYDVLGYVEHNYSYSIDDDISFPIEGKVVSAKSERIDEFEQKELDEPE